MLNSKYNSTMQIGSLWLTRRGRLRYQTPTYPRWSPVGDEDCPSSTLGSIIHEGFGYVSLEASNIGQQLSVGQGRMFIGLCQLCSKLQTNARAEKWPLRASSMKEIKLPSKALFAESRSCDSRLTLHVESAAQRASPQLSYLQPKCLEEDRLSARVLYLQFR